jgi:histidinol-phosphate aminotransferase
LATELRARAIIVRHFNAPRISDYLRITVGSNEQVEILLAALEEIVGR